jgi:hypothetical protein
MVPVSNFFRAATEAVLKCWVRTFGQPWIAFSNHIRHCRDSTNLLGRDPSTDPRQKIETKMRILTDIINRCKLSSLYFLCPRRNWRTLVKFSERLSPCCAIDFCNWACCNAWPQSSMNLSASHHNESSCVRDAWWQDRDSLSDFPCTDTRVLSWLLSWCFVAFDKEVWGKMVRKQPSDLSSLEMASAPDLIHVSNPYTYILSC